MDRFIHGRWRRWSWAGVAAIAVAVGLVLGPALGVTHGTGLWTERPATVAPSMTQAPAWVELARAVKPAVVNISTKRVDGGRTSEPGRSGPSDPFDQFFQPFMGQRPPRTLRSLGSGFIINQSGYVVTNNHVVDGATEIRVKLSDGRDLVARVAGRDPKTDLALLKVDASGLPVVPLGDSGRLEVGEPVMAIGNPFGLEQTVTTGIVSATGRVIGEGPYDDFVQTDASINPGNSGGPLVNARGEAIGINSAIVSRSGGSVGIGFAIPINLAKPILTQLASTGHVVRGWLGVAIQPVTAELAKSFGLGEPAGALVASVVGGSPAMQAGIKAGDVITEYNGKKVARADALPRAVADTPVGRDVPVTLVRDGKPMKVTVKVSRLAEAGEPKAETSTSKPSLGLTVEPLNPEVAARLGVDDAQGLLVRDVQDDSAAANAGLRAGDVIVEVNHHRVKSMEDFRRDLAQHPKGTPVLMLLHRNGDNLYVAVPA